MTPAKQKSLPKPPNRCFVCGEANARGFRLQFQYQSEHKLAECVVTIPDQYQGATGYAHGGIIATLLDEAMAKANGLAGIRTVTLRITVRYRKMVPLQSDLLLSGRRIRRKGRKIYLESKLMDAQRTVLAEARGLFLEIVKNETP